MKGDTIKGLYKEVYGKYEGTYTDNPALTYITTDRYFEKYVLQTEQGIFEIWAGGYREKNDVELNNFEPEHRLDSLAGLKIVEVVTEPDKLLLLQLSNGIYFEIGLCPEYNIHNHPERYMKLVKGDMA